ncbi:HAMP domain-containing sensor histidine kinase [Acidithiobacillus ferriphilus]|jgi:two-component system sensor histidine kinase GlrK|uniref:HAMP domain-containing sensor histidine kinase n=1 Tax=Acidithiobacillus ferriphilus TaxID=1689834 RepID=UPI00242DA915|nr:ATP-binding protein [Acidithiobacillus ferriphilus]MBW9253633.1 HAMP domain-containing protein [Acidithiobacillus ferriphilus]
MALRPSSISKLAVIGFGLVIVPLVLVIVSVTISIAHFAEQGQVSILRAVAMSDAANRMNNAVRSMERYGLQYTVLQDQALLVLYDQSFTEYKKSSARFAAAGPSPVDRRRLQRLADHLAHARQMLPLVSLGGNRGALESDFSRASAEAQHLQSDVNEGISTEVAKLGTRALAIKRLTIVEVLLVLPLSIAFAILFIVLITRPIRRLDQAVSGLGDGDLETPIAVQGPRDIASLGDRLEWLRNRLNALEAAKLHFLRQLSHELKTPLTAIREGAELLQEDLGHELGADEQQEIVHIVRDNSLRLQRLIEDLLRFSLAEGPVGAGMVQDISLTAVVEDLLLSYKPSLRSKSLHLVTELADVRVRGHEDRLRTICDNLLSNGVKFSPQNATIRIYLQVQDEQAVLDVQDEGPGVAPAEREKIFDILYRGEASDAGKVEGSGLGLAIAREYVLSYGGSLELLDKETPGACFRLRLPLIDHIASHGAYRADLGGLRSHTVDIIPPQHSDPQAR